MTARPTRDLSKQMEQAAARASAVPAVGTGGTPTPRAKPVRLSLDLAPVAYRELQEFCTAAAVTLERPRVAGAEVLRSLLAELVDDEALAARVRDRLAAD